MFPTVEVSQPDTAPLPEPELELEQLPPLPESTSASPTLAPAEESLPLPEITPVEPTPESLPLPLVEDELAARHESRPASPTFCMRLPPYLMFDGWLADNYAAIDESGVSESGVEDEDSSPSLSKNRSVSPVLGMFLPHPRLMRDPLTP